MIVTIEPGTRQQMRVTTGLEAIVISDVTLVVPGFDAEDRADWLMGFWEQLTETMAEYADKDHLTDWVRKAAYAIDDEHIVRKEFIL